MGRKRIIIALDVDEDTDIFDVHEEIEGLSFMPDDIEEAYLSVYESESAYLAENEG